MDSIVDHTDPYAVRRSPFKCFLFVLKTPRKNKLSILFSKYI